MALSYYVLGQYYENVFSNFIINPYMSLNNLGMGMNIGY